MYSQSSGSVSSLGYIILSAVPYNVVSLVFAARVSPMRKEQARRGSLSTAIDSFSSQLGVPGNLSVILRRHDGKLHISAHVYLVQSLRRHHNSMVEAEKRYRHIPGYIQKAVTVPQRSI